MLEKGEVKIKPEKIFRVWVTSALLSLFLLVHLQWAGAMDLKNPSLQSATTYVGGIIDKDTIWKSTESPYIVTGNLTVDRNATLTIEAGVVVKFTGYYYLMVEGALDVVGSQSAPVTFTSNASSPSSNDWKGIQSSGFNSIMAFNYAKIEYASIGIDDNNGNLTIVNSEISFNDVGIYYFQHSHSNSTQGNIIDNTISSNNIGVQIDIYYGPVGNLKLENNVITYNDDGVKLEFFNEESFNVSIRRNIISLNNASGVEIEGAAPSTSVVNVTQNYITFNGQNGIYLNLWKKEAFDVFSIEDNDVHDNKAYGFKLGSHISFVEYVFSASRNYWGTEDTARIDEKIYDFYDDHKLGKVSYTPILDFPLEARYPDVAIDRAAPVLSISSNLNNTYTRWSNVSVKWTVQDAGSGIEHYAVKLDHNQEVNLGTVTNYGFENMSEEAHIILVFAFDKAGNTGEALVNICVDLTPPIISDVSKANGSEIRASLLNLTWSGSDTISGIDHYEIKLDKDEWINLAGQTNYTFTYLPDGRHTIIIKALDKAQNSIEINLSLAVNTSFLFGPGWIDDAALFGGISMVVIIAVLYFFIKRRKVEVSLETTRVNSSLDDGE